MKMFLLGFITAIVAIPVLVFLYWLAVFMWGDWRTGEIWSAIKQRRQLRKYEKENRRTD